MKILLISGEAPLPETLRDILVKGSTALVESRAGGTSGAADDADRIVFWAGASDPAVRAAAEAYARATDRRADRLVFVAERGAETPAGLASGERFEWPADEDRLRMAFMTSA